MSFMSGPTISPVLYKHFGHESIEYLENALLGASEGEIYNCGIRVNSSEPRGGSLPG